MSIRFTIQQLEDLKATGKIRGYEVINTQKPLSFPENPKNYSGKSGKNIPGRKHKYAAERTEIDGIWFDSAKEAKRYVQLRYLKLSGAITDLLLQVEFELNHGGTHSLKYIADFVYKDVKTGEVIVEDVKGYRTVEYKKKRRLMLEVHGITIKEV
jgi:hypothetical protein